MSYSCRCKLFVTATEIEECLKMSIDALSSGCDILFLSDEFSLLDKNLGDYYEKLGTVNERAIERAQHFCWNRCADQTYKVLTEWQ